MKFFRWIPGRQAGCVYHKWCFLYSRIGRVGFDGYILRYPAGSILPPHQDKIPGKMWRMNIKLRGKAQFYCADTILSLGQFLHLFRPDLEVHGLNVQTKTYKLSIGLAIF